MEDRIRARPHIRNLETIADFELGNGIEPEPATDSDVIADVVKIVESERADLDRAAGIGRRSGQRGSVRDVKRVAEFGGADRDATTHLKAQERLRE